MFLTKNIEKRIYFSQEKNSELEESNVKSFKQLIKRLENLLLQDPKIRILSLKIK